MMPGNALKIFASEEQETLSKLTNRVLRGMLRNEQHASIVSCLCDQPICKDCPVEAEMMERKDDLAGATVET